MFIAKQSAFVGMDGTNGQALHLPDLRIQNLRGVASLSVRRLGRVTLLTGRNGVGKTTVLEAVWMLAARGDSDTLSRLLWQNDELKAALGERDSSNMELDYLALFNGRNAHPDHSIWIGPYTGEYGLSIQLLTIEDLSNEQRARMSQLGCENVSHVFKVAVGDTESLQVPLNDRSEYNSHSIAPSGPAPLPKIWEFDRMGPGALKIPCRLLESGFPMQYDLARDWDEVAGTEAEDAILETLRLVHTGLERILPAAGPGLGRRVAIKLRGYRAPVPLNSLGRGVERLFSVAVAIANVRNGFLLIDALENSLHHSIHRDTWRMLISAAHKFNVQILATTHSFDCVRGLAAAATEQDDCVLVRVDRFGRDLNAVEYTLEEFSRAADSGIEVR